MIKSKKQIGRIIDKLLEITEKPSARQLSLEYFGTENVVANWKSQESISSEGIDIIMQICKEKNINLNWMFLDRGTRYYTDVSETSEELEEYQKTGDLRDVFAYMEFALDIYDDYRSKYDEGIITEEEYRHHMKILKREIHMRTFRASPE